MVALSVPAEPVAVEIAADTRFHIDNDQAANWLLGKLANIDTEIARVQAQAALIVKQLQADRDSLLYLYQGELSAYVSQKIEKSGGRRKTIHFLQGSCSFRRVPAHVSLTDLSAAIEHAREAGLPVFKSVEKFDTESYRTLAEAWRDSTAGELLPGVIAVPDTDRFSIKFPGRKGGEEA